MLYLTISFTYWLYVVAQISDLFDLPDLLSYLIAVCALLGDLLELKRVNEALTY
jgi:hypothetical protein